MKAFVYEGGTKFSVRELPMPKAGKGEAVAKILCASICGTDLRTYRFGSEKLKTPITIGHEACYEIVENGEGVSLSGRYILAPAIGCGKCRSCKKGRTNMCDTLRTIGFQYPGTFAEYFQIPAEAIEQGHMIRVPGNVSNNAASVVEPVACAINAQSYLNIAEGDSVLIYGAGYLGCVHAELALMQGAEKVVIAEVSEKRRNKAKTFVPEAVVINSGEKGYLEQVRDIVGGVGVDVVITACPAGITHRQGLELLNKNGRMSLFGGLPGENNYHLDSNLIHYKEASVYGAHASTVLQNQKALELVANGQLNVEKYITEYALEDADKAFRCLIDETAEKAVLIP
ncbi:MAG TPA: alcohol dehydrogenase catalytic domain-containing protein [Negativicutes bacterium]|nr:alcohol dehydrogenase catalytic domain-containing protein [Negativicutes bacterium]